MKKCRIQRAHQGGPVRVWMMSQIQIRNQSWWKEGVRLVKRNSRYNANRIGSKSSRNNLRYTPFSSEDRAQTKSQDLLRAFFTKTTT